MATEPIQTTEPIDTLTIRLPKGLNVNLEFFDLKPGEEMPQVDTEVLIHVRRGSFVLSTKDSDVPQTRGKDAIC
jgi:hypothetical protein